MIVSKVLTNIITNEILQMEEFTMQDLYEKFPNVTHKELLHIVTQLIKDNQLDFWDKYMVVKK